MAVPSNEDIIKQWDEFSNKYEEYLEPSTTTIANVLIHSIGIGNKGETEHERVADICCGPGSAAKLFCQKRQNENISLYALDIVDKMVTKCTERTKDYANVFTQVGSAQQLPFPDEYFTGYFSNLGLQLVANEDEMIKEAYRVLKPKGKAAFSIWGTPERSPFMTIFKTVLQKLNLCDQSKPPVRNNFHLGGNPSKLREKFLSLAPFSTFVTWSQPMIMSPISAEYCVEALTAIPANAQLISTFEPEIQEKIRNEIFSAAKSLIESSNQPLCLDIEIIYVTK